jgi:hypothetical protein
MEARAALIRPFRMRATVVAVNGNYFGQIWSGWTRNQCEASPAGYLTESI